MPESFGTQLREQREKCGIALTAIAKQTRIKEALLEALERDDLSQWPSGFYRRAFFRAYAAAIQLDPDVSFREFQSVHPEPPEVDVLTAMATTLGRGDANGRSTALRHAVGSAFSSLSLFRRGAESPHPPADVTTAGLPSNAGASRTDASPASGAGEPYENPMSEPSAVPAVRAVESNPDLLELASLCAEFGCVTTEAETIPLLQEAARLLDATGLILWAWNPRVSQLQPALYYGYSPEGIAQLPLVRRDDDNATAAAFRTVQPKVIQDAARGECAFVLPLRTPSGCVGVFAVELQRGQVATRSRIAVATLISAQLAPIADCIAQPEQLRLPQAVNGAAT